MAAPGGYGGGQPTLVNNGTGTAPAGLGKGGVGGQPFNVNQAASGPLKLLFQIFPTRTKHSTKRRNRSKSTSISTSFLSGCVDWMPTMST